MEYLFIYLLQVCSNIEALDFMLGFLIICAILALLVVAIITAITVCDSFSTDYEKEKIKTVLKTISKISLVLIALDFIIANIPTKQTMLLMGGTYYGKKAVKQVVTSQKLEKVNTIIDLQLDKYIKDLSKEVK